MKPVAKGKKRRTEIAEDAQRLIEDEQRILKDVRKSDQGVRHRDEIETVQVVNIWADEIQAYYEDLGGSIDEINAQDKALTIWREIMTKSHVAAREQEIPYVTCKEHS
jgi:hypothetical protein